MLEDKSIDVVHVCAPNKSHAEISVAAMEAGKHIMCEKPMAKNVKDALLMVKAAKKTGKKLSPSEAEAKQWIDSIVNDTQPLVKMEEAYTVSRIIDAIYDSAKTGKQINLEETSL